MLSEYFFCYVEESKALLVLFNLQAPAAADILVSVQTIWDWLQIITLGFLLAVTRHMDTMTNIEKGTKKLPLDNYKQFKSQFFCYSFIVLPT